MMKKLIYIVDDEPLQLNYLRTALRKINYLVRTFSDPYDFLQALDTNTPDIAVIDLVMPQLSGVELIGEIRSKSPRLPIIAVTAYPEIESAIGAVRAGANDYLKKPFQTAELQLVVERLLQSAHLRDNLDAMIDKNASQYSLDAFIGSSPIIETIRVELQRLADMPNENVIITGQNGSGKSYAARILHYAHPDASKRLVEINCARHTKEELEAELFGWDEELPDGSLLHHPSLCEVAEGGTILLDYISQADLDTQRKLHEFLLGQSSTDEGGKGTTCRIIAATTVDLDSPDASRAIDPLLLEHFSLFRVDMPALHVRGEDIIALALHFIETSESSTSVNVRGLTDAAKDELLEYPWPGNVRELKSVIERALVTTETHMIDAKDLHLGSTYHTKGDESIISDTLSSLRELEIQQIRRVLEYTHGDVTKAAQILGISRKSLWERRKRYSLD
jgi:DNA-binding NtrC family response regulator